MLKKLRLGIIGLKNRPTIFVMFAMLGPYHVARLNAVAAGSDVIGVEGSSLSATYDWHKTVGCGEFQRLTLFPDEPIERKTTAEIRDAIFIALEAIRPCAVALPGWSSRWSMSLMEWSLRHRTPVVMMSESQAGDAPRKAWKEAIKSRVVAMSQAALVGGSKHVAYMMQLGMPKERIFTGYDVVDNEHFFRGANVARANAETFRKHHRLPDRFLLASARFITKKNLLALIAAYAAATRGRTAPPHLVLLGGGREQAAVQAAIASHNVGAHVHLPGFRQYDELPVYYGLAEGFVHVSLTEQWGLVINEAMASGLPVIVSRTCGAAPELVQDGVNGFLVDPDSIESMASAIATLIELPQATRDRMGAASRRIIANWGPERFASGLVSAAEAARAAPTRRLALWDRLLLQGLSRQNIADLD